MWRTAKIAADFFPSLVEVASISVPLDLVGHATFFGQWDFSKNDSNRGLKSACASKLACSYCSWQSAALGRSTDDPN